MWTDPLGCDEVLMHSHIRAVSDWHNLLSDNELLHTKYLSDILSCHTMGLSDISESDRTVSDGWWQSESLIMVIIRDANFWEFLNLVVIIYTYGRIKGKFHSSKHVHTCVYSCPNNHKCSFSMLSIILHSNWNLVSSNAKIRLWTVKRIRKMNEFLPIMKLTFDF